MIEKAGNKWTEAGTLVGSGPFLLKEWAHNDHMTLVANPNWHGGRARLNEVRIKIMPEDTTAYAAYMTGDLDTSSVPPANRKEVMASGSPLNKQLVRKNELTTFGLEFNEKEKPWDNAMVRQAFGMAFDRKAYIEGVLQGVGQPTTSWLPPGMPGYDKDVGKKYEFDANKAKQLLAAAGFANGQGLAKVTLMIVPSDTNRLIGQFMQDQFKKNLNVDLTWSTWTARHISRAIRSRSTTSCWAAGAPTGRSRTTGSTSTSASVAATTSTTSTRRRSTT